MHLRHSGIPTSFLRSLAALGLAVLCAGCGAEGSEGPGSDGEGATLVVSVAALLGDEAPTGVRSLRVRLYQGPIDSIDDVPIYDTDCIDYQGETLRLYNQPPGEGYALLVDLFSDTGCGTLAHRGLRGSIAITKAGNDKQPYVIPVATVGAFRRLPGLAGEHFPLGPWRVRAFHSAAAIGDGQVAIVGGAESVNGDQIIGGDGWPVIFDSRDMLFWRVSNGPLGGQRIMAHAVAGLPDGHLVVAGGIQALRFEVREVVEGRALTFDVPEHICYTNECNTPNFVQRISLVDVAAGTAEGIPLATGRVFPTLDTVELDAGTMVVLAGGVPGADRFDDYDAFGCVYGGPTDVNCEPVTHVAPRAGQASACYRTDGAGTCTALALVGGAAQSPAGSAPFVEILSGPATDFAAAAVPDAPTAQKRLMARAAGSEGVLFVTGGVEGATLPSGDLVGGGSITISAGGNGSFVPFAGGEGLDADAGRLVFHTVTALGVGRVLVAGGLDADLEPTDRAFVLRADGDTFVVETVLSLTTPRLAHTATRIDGGPLDGAVLVTGGFQLDDDGKLVLVDTAEIFLPAFAVTE